jgi:hypothetical protein
VYVKCRGLLGNIRIPYFVGLVLFRRKYISRRIKASHCDASNSVLDDFMLELRWANWRLGRAFTEFLRVSPVNYRSTVTRYSSATDTRGVR